jgi:hypothetical protein
LEEETCFLRHDHDHETAVQELDYATNFLADGPGEWKDSGLGKAFRAAVANPDGINIIDWEPYGPSGLDRMEKLGEDEKI